MVLGLYSLLEAGLLCLNAICVLHEERFLVKLGWSVEQRGFGEEPSVKVQILSFIRSVRTVTRIPLIGLNILVILVKLAFG